MLQLCVAQFKRRQTEENIHLLVKSAKVQGLYLYSLMAAIINWYLDSLGSGSPTSASTALLLGPDNV